jgi:hypothetical protein
MMNAAKGDRAPPVRLLEDLSDGLELPRDDLGRLVRLALLQVLADAEDDVDAGLDRRGGLFSPRKGVRGSVLWLE